jgi:CubicO group peptidase (beta-lactamase class C family)
MKVQFILLILLYTFLTIPVSCSKVEKTIEGVVKINENGIPVMQPLQEEFPALQTTYLNDKKYGVSMFFEKTWSQKNDNVAFLVAKDGHIIYENYLGFANKKTDEKITKDTPLHIASVSKVITATAILMLVDAKKLTLEQDVKTILTNFPYDGITVQDLLNHRSGLRNYAYFTYENNNWDKKKMLSNEDIIKVMIEKNIEIERKPNTGFSYNNTNYALLALIVEKITEMKFPQALDEMIFKPLGMTNTYVCDFEKDKTRLIPSYKGNNVEIGTDYLDAVYGDKNIYSTPRDLLKFDTARMASFFLNPDLIAKMHQGYSYETKGQRNYGLGIRMVEFNKGETFYFHNGWWHGNTSSFINLRKERVCIITLSNKYTKKTYQSKKLAGLFGDYPFNVSDGED